MKTDFCYKLKIYIYYDIISIVIFRSYANKKIAGLYILVKRLLGGIDMKFQRVNIATARIKGLKNSPYYFEPHCYYAWDIIFEDTSTLFFNNLPFIKVGNTEEEGKVFCNQLKENFNKAHIYDGDKVAVIFEDDGRVLAIGNI